MSITQTTSENSYQPTGPAESRTPVELRSMSTGELVRRLSEQVTDLVRGEFQLARDELSAKGKRIGMGAGLAGAAGVVALGGFGALIAGAIAALALVLPVWAAALVVGAALLAVAGVLALIGRRQVQEASPPVPELAIRSTKRDVDAVKERIKR